MFYHEHRRARASGDKNCRGSAKVDVIFVSGCSPDQKRSFLVFAELRRDREKEREGRERERVRKSDRDVARDA